LEETERQKLMAVRVVIVDDYQDEAKSIADLLQGEGVSIDLLAPSAEVTATATAALDEAGDTGPRVLLLDYRLGDHPRPDVGSPAGFKGGAVAGAIREADPDIPIVLFTSEEKLHEWVDTRPGIKTLFDWTVTKKDAATVAGADIARKQIIDYANAWETVRGWGNDETLWRSLADLLRAPDDEIKLFEDLEAESPNGALTAEVMHWIQKRALAIPGPLVDAPTARVILGVSEASFQLPEVTSWLDNAKYKGALSSFAERWWGRTIRTNIAAIAGGSRPLDASDRAAALAGELGAELEPEGCTWCGGELTLQACNICQKAVDAAHSVRPVLPPLPGWADAWVICYRCVAGGRANEMGIDFPPSSREIVEQLEEGGIEPPESG
jgi:CheY-like chemotaxis protein